LPVLRTSSESTHANNSEANYSAWLRIEPGQADNLASLVCTRSSSRINRDCIIYEQYSSLPKNGGHLFLSLSVCKIAEEF